MHGDEDYKLIVLSLISVKDGLLRDLHFDSVDLDNLETLCYLESVFDPSYCDTYPQYLRGFTQI